MYSRNIKQTNNKQKCYRETFYFRITARHSGKLTLSKFDTFSLHHNYKYFNIFVKNRIEKEKPASKRRK